MKLKIAKQGVRVNAIPLITTIFMALLLVSNTQASEQDIGCEHKLLKTLAITFAGPSGLPTIEGSMNDKPVTMLFDTGAGQTYIMPAAAEKLALRVGQASSDVDGVGGVTSRSVTRPNNFSVGPIYAERPYLFVLNNLGFDPYFGAIVGADFLYAMSFDVSFENKQISFFQTSGCKDEHLASWDKESSVIDFKELTENDQRPQFTITVNGLPFRTIIDTAAGKSAIDLQAAERLGITPKLAGVTKGQEVQGAGSDSTPSWVIELESIIIGNERIKNQKMDMLRLPTGSGKTDPEILLGKDFLMKHRVLFAMDQRRLYISNK